MALESPIARAGQLARQILVHGRTLTIGELIERVDGVTVEGVRRVADSIFTGRPTLAAIGPIGGLIAHEHLTARLGAPAAA
jgi:predicted Zn-dependent peptidase